MVGMFEAFLEEKRRSTEELLALERRLERNEETARRALEHIRGLWEVHVREHIPRNRIRGFWPPGEFRGYSTS